MIQIQAVNVRGLPESNHTPVFHASRECARYGDHVLFWKRKRHLEVIFKERQNLWPYHFGISVNYINLFVIIGDIVKLP